MATDRSRQRQFGSRRRDTAAALTGSADEATMAQMTKELAELRAASGTALDRGNGSGRIWWLPRSSRRG
jgi:hypothetical protein